MQSLQLVKKTKPDMDKMKYRELKNYRGTCIHSKLQLFKIINLYKKGIN